MPQELDESMLSLSLFRISTNHDGMCIWFLPKVSCACIRLQDEGVITEKEARTNISHDSVRDGVCFFLSKPAIIDR